MNQPKGLFITGTDTGIGKTLVAAILAVALQQRLQQGFSYLKPMESGIKNLEDLSRKSDGARVQKAAGLPHSLEEIIPFRFREPLAPLLAARRQQQVVSHKTLLNTVREHLHQHEFTLMEGAGGLMVPLCPGYLVENLISDLQLPALVVCRSALGGINHTLLTLSRLRQAKIPVVGIIINHATGNPGIAEQNFAELIREFDSVPILGELPFVPDFSFRREALLSLADQLDIEQLLKAIKAIRNNKTD
ncbi:MAG: dethiobiotin synthase [Pseudomonadota bacterium]|nr:dethiobiotin synthase [Pseudomonadota bacterium]